MAPRMNAKVDGRWLSAPAGGVAMYFAWRILTRPDSLVGIPLGLLFASLAALAWWHTLRSTRPASLVLMNRVFQWGLWVGFIGFVLGFVGPLLFADENATVAPVIGIIVTGPSGFIVGVICGLATGVIRTRGASAS